MDKDGTLKVDWNEWRNYLLLHPSSDLKDIVAYWRHATVSRKCIDNQLHVCSAICKGQDWLSLLKLRVIDYHSFREVGPDTVVYMRISILEYLICSAIFKVYLYFLYSWQGNLHLKVIRVLNFFWNKKVCPPSVPHNYQTPSVWVCFTSLTRAKHFWQDLYQHKKSKTSHGKLVSWLSQFCYHKLHVVVDWKQSKTPENEFNLLKTIQFHKYLHTIHIQFSLDLQPE